ncbi:MAG: divalent-cation tolerance protein CutA [Acidobacteriaceae bacterium]|nr:divalent-cation tolerance protein CutA [Acidobacteriaceae bacterium]MBV9781152.1 divalent-cation tolerance protein CutA [Acidobacteriaceae bacterium]
MNDAVVVLCTCGKENEALKIANAVIEERLAACANVLPPLQSVYRWQDKIETAQEILILIKTTREHFPAVRDRLAELHTYDTPEIVALPIIDGSEKYLAWLREQV